MNDVFNYLLNWDQDAFKCPPELESLDRVMLNTEEVQTELPSNAEHAIILLTDMPLKVQHVYCLEDRISLMVCLTKYKREKREAESTKRGDQKPS